MVLVTQSSKLLTLRFSEHCVQLLASITRDCVLLLPRRLRIGRLVGAQSTDLLVASSQDRFHPSRLFRRKPKGTRQFAGLMRLVVDAMRTNDESRALLRFASMRNGADAAGEKAEENDRKDVAHEDRDRTPKSR